MSIQNLFTEGTTVISSQFLPQGSDGTQNLNDILTNGNDGGGNNITNVHYVMPNALIFNNGGNNSHQLFQDTQSNICYLNFYPNSNSYQQGIVFDPTNNTLKLLANNSSPVLKVGANGGTVYDSIYNLPPNMQPAYNSYFQNFNLTAGNINLVPITNNTLSTVFLGLYNLTTILNLFPDCNHFKLTINSVQLYSITGSQPGSVNVQFLLTDVFPFSSIALNDLSKNLSFPSASLSYTNGASSSLSSLNPIDFYSNSPQNLNLVISINADDIGDLHLNRMYLNMSLVADDGEYNFLTTIST
jgi:hypothetical protein